MGKGGGGERKRRDEGQEGDYTMLVMFQGLEVLGSVCGV